MWNNIKLTLLLSAMTALFLLVGRAVGGDQGLVLGLAFAVVTNFGSWWFSDRIVLAMHGAREIGAEDAPEFYAMVAGLARAAKLPMPRVYVIPSEAPNAFATGRDPAHAAVAATAGILRVMPMDELRAVMAHELGHVARRDTLISTVAATLAGAISFIANIAQWGLLFGGRGDDRDRNPLAAIAAIVLAPLVATIIQLAVSRSREYGADEYAARLIGSGEPLARALVRIESLGQRGLVMPPNQATSHLYIANPLSGRGLLTLFRTHPLTEDRVARLRRLEGELQR